MRKVLGAATVGFIAGWVFFTSKGKEMAKDLCLLAFDPTGTSSDKISTAIRAIMTKNSIPEVESHDAPSCQCSCKTREKVSKEQANEITSSEVRSSTCCSEHRVGFASAHPKIDAAESQLTSMQTTVDVVQEECKNESLGNTQS